MKINSTITALLETFQEFTTRGEKATLFLETRNGVEFATLQVKLPASHTTRTPAGTNLGSSAKKRKSPSTLKRDRERLVNYRNKSLQDSWGLKTSTPSIKATLVSQPLPASCSSVVETLNEVGCDTAKSQRK